MWEKKNVEVLVCGDVRVVLFEFDGRLVERQTSLSID